MKKHGNNVQSDLVLILMEQASSLQAVPFSQPQSRSVLLTSRQCLVVEVASGARHLATVLLLIFHDRFLWCWLHRMTPKQ